MRSRSIFAFLALALSACSSGVTGTEEGSGQIDVFSRDVLPLLAANCSAASCHQAGTPTALSSGFGLQNTASATYQSMMSDPTLIVPGNPEGSRLFVEIAEGEMPPGGALKNSDAQRIIGEWIQAGAPRYADPGEEPEPPASFETANGLRGGQFYDEFFAEGTGYAGRPALTTADRAKIAQFPDFYRCKQCHGWDQRGRTGAYANRAPRSNIWSGTTLTRAGRPNVASVDLAARAALLTPEELFAAIKGTGKIGRRTLADDYSNYNPATIARVGDAMPDYGELMTDAEIWDLVRFLKVERVDPSAFYTLTVTGTYPTATVTVTNLGLGGVAASGDQVFAANCSGCHGADGTVFAIEGLSVGQFLRTKPTEAQHKAKFGQPGTAMGAMVRDQGEMLDLFAAVLDTAKYPDYTAYAGADGIRGGMLYDRFFAFSTGFPFESQLSDADYNRIVAYPDFFRCKQCHGWDRLGRNGGYIGRAPRATRPNVAPVDLAAFAAESTPQEIYDALARTSGRRSVSTDLSAYDPATNNVEGDKMPKLADIMPTADLWDLARFLKADALDTTVLYTLETTGAYPTGTATFTQLGRDGDAAAGAEVYAGECSRCHGSDGTDIELEGNSLGVFARSKPHETQHKAKFGNPDSWPYMEGGLVTDVADAKNLLKALSDATAFPPMPPH